MADHKLLLENSRKVDKAYNAWLSVPNSKELRNIYEALLVEFNHDLIEVKNKIVCHSSYSGSSFK